MRVLKVQAQCLQGYDLCVQASGIAEQAFLQCGYGSAEYGQALDQEAQVWAQYAQVAFAF